MTSEADLQPALQDLAPSVHHRRSLTTLDRPAAQPSTPPCAQQDLRRYAERCRPGLFRVWSSQPTHTSIAIVRPVPVVHLPVSAGLALPACPSTISSKAYTPSFLRGSFTDVTVFTVCRVPSLFLVHRGCKKEARRWSTEPLAGMTFRSPKGRESQLRQPPR